MCDRETEAQQFRELVMSKIHCQRPWRYKFEFSFVENDRWPWSQKSGMCGEHRNTPDSPDLSPSIPDDRGYLRFWVFISRHNLGQSGNNKIPDRLGFSRHMKTRLQAPPCSLLLRYRGEPFFYGYLSIILFIGSYKNKWWGGLLGDKFSMKKRRFQTPLSSSVVFCRKKYRLELRLFSHF